MQKTKKIRTVLENKTYKVHKEKPKINFKSKNRKIEERRINFCEIVVKTIEILGVIGNLVILLKDY
jgi:hypothetical protein